MIWKKCIYSTASIFIFMGVSKFCDKKTGKFSVHRVENNFDITQDNEPSDDPLPDDLLSIISQPFTYLSKGKTSFVFASSDGKYVIKLFNNRYQRKINYFEKLSHIPMLKNWAKQKRDYNQKKLERNYKSFHIAKDILPKETAFIYLHENPKSHYFEIMIQDKLGSFHKIKSDKTAFFIQRKASPFYETLLKIKSDNDIEKGKKLLTSLFDLLITRSLKGVEDKDAILRTNFGFFNDEAVELDVGPFIINNESAKKNIYSREIYKTTLPLKQWLSINYQELSPYLQDLYQNNLDIYE